MANYKIEEVEGIGPERGKSLRDAGIINTDSLLMQSKTVKDRQNLAAATGLSEHQILKYANMVDLFRIDGVGSEFAELLEVSGVDTVPELAQRNAENLTQKMEEVNKVKLLCKRIPVLKEVSSWIDQAKSLPRVLEY